MRSKRIGLEGRRGLLTIEFMLWLLIVFTTFMSLLFLGFELWIQLRVEDAATLLVRTAARQDRDPGDVEEIPIFPTPDGSANNGLATIEWGDEFVQVTVVAVRGIRPKSAVRLLPREVL